MYPKFQYITANIYAREDLRDFMSEHSEQLKRIKQVIQQSEQTRAQSEKLTQKHDELKEKWNKKPKLVDDSGIA